MKALESAKYNKKTLMRVDRMANKTLFDLKMSKHTANLIKASQNTSPNRIMDLFCSYCAVLMQHVQTQGRCF